MQKETGGMGWADVREYGLKGVKIGSRHPKLPRGP